MQKVKAQLSYTLENGRKVKIPHPLWLASHLAQLEWQLQREEERYMLLDNLFNALLKEVAKQQNLTRAETSMLAEEIIAAS